MIPDGITGLALGAIGLGVVHGVEPGHGWPVAATYALDRSNTWLAGVAASAILGVGHLISSIAMVLVFFWAKDYFGLTQIGWMNYVAGALLILLGLREYRMYRRGGHHHGGDHGHGHPDGDDHQDDEDVGHRGHGHDAGHRHEDSGHHLANGRSHDHHAADGHAPGDEGHVHADEEHTHDGHGYEHGYDHDHDHEHGHDHDGAGGVVGTLISLLPVDLIPDQPDPSEASERGILGIAVFAFALGFAHEEEFEIIALCMGSNHCLELMLVYALTVVVAIVGFTLLLIAGYEHYEERAEAYAEYLPLFSAAVLVLMGLGFVLHVF